MTLLTKLTCCVIDPQIMLVIPILHGVIIIRATWKDFIPIIPGLHIVHTEATVKGNVDFHVRFACVVVLEVGVVG